MTYAGGRMRIFNTRTWFRCGQAFPWLLGGLALTAVCGLDLTFVWVALLGLGFLGGFQGLLFAVGKLELGCPTCDQDADVLGWTQDRATVMECPHCGTIAAKPTGLFKIEISQIVEDKPDAQEES